MISFFKWLKNITFINLLSETLTLQSNTNKCLRIDILYKQLLALAKVHIEISLLLIPVLYLLRLPSNLYQFSTIKHYSCKNNSLCILYIDVTDVSVPETCVLVEHQKIPVQQIY